MKLRNSNVGSRRFSRNELADVVSVANRKCLSVLRDIGRPHARSFHALMKTHPDVEHILLLNGLDAALRHHPRDQDYEVRRSGLERLKTQLLLEKDTYAAAVILLRTEFGKEMLELVGSLAIPIAEHASDLAGIALANGKTVEWLFREVKKAKLKFRAEFRRWIVIAADGDMAVQGWRAPYWLNKFPAPLDFRTSVASALPGRFGSVETSRILRAIGSKLDRGREKAARAALDRAYIEIAKRNPTHARIESGLVHSPDYRSIQWRGKTYGLTERQAKVVQFLDEAHRTGTPDLAIRTILAKLGTPESDLRDTFRDSPRFWGQEGLIRPGAKRGTVRLNVP